MSWNAMTYDGKETVLRVVRDQAERFFTLAEVPETWTAKTACPEWDVRDIVGHIVDTTETYFPAFDAARSDTEVAAAYGLPGMAKRAEEQGKSFRDLPQKEMVDRLRTDFDKMMGIFESLTPEDWTGLMVPHFYMGPVPAFFYPAFQLMDYGIHSWDILRRRRTRTRPAQRCGGSTRTVHVRDLGRDHAGGTGHRAAQDRCAHHHRTQRR